MKITAIAIENVRGFQLVPKTDFSNSINVFIGPNNAGKSTVLNSIFLIQRPSVLNRNDITLGQKQGKIELNYEGSHLQFIYPNSEFNKLIFRNVLVFKLWMSENYLWLQPPKANIF